MADTTAAPNNRPVTFRGKTEHEMAVIPKPKNSAGEPADGQAAVNMAGNPPKKLAPKMPKAMRKKSQ